uniref:Uncharacterized protein n=1 Tax=Ditylum brightwellii TaxID=49249 RepID=A0A7S4WJ30_9STRA|mmetsp:Transcript_29464/g.44523  ORF Transcript_29464/g.44523 Transcript_29464/m.44523 type:complete len:202 (+) Transcript_29464:81-686(+)
MRSSLSKSIITFFAFMELMTMKVNAFSSTCQSRTSLVVCNAGYVPDGLTPQQWANMKLEEKRNNSSKEYGRLGPKGFTSRSLQSFQEDLDKGKVDHLMPVMNAKFLIEEGVIQPEDVPYMQRGGSWDNSDVKNAEKKEWNSIDKKFKEKEQQFRLDSVDWTGKKTRSGPTEPTKAATARAKATASIKGNKEHPKNIFFGWF